MGISENSARFPQSSGADNDKTRFMADSLRTAQSSSSKAGSMGCADVFAG